MVVQTTKVTEKNAQFLSALSTLRQEIESVEHVEGFKVAQDILDFLVIFERVELWINKEPEGSNPKRLGDAITTAFAVVNTLRADRFSFFNKKVDVATGRKSFEHFANLLDSEIQSAKKMSGFCIPDMILRTSLNNIDMMAVISREPEDAVALYKEAMEQSSTALNTLRRVEEDFLADRQTIEALLERTHALRVDAVVFNRVEGGLFSRIAGIKRLIKEGRGLAIVRTEYVGLEVAITSAKNEIATKTVAINLALTIKEMAAKPKKSAPKSKNVRSLEDASRRLKMKGKAGQKSNPHAGGGTSKKSRRNKANNQQKSA